MEGESLPTDVKTLQRLLLAAQQTTEVSQRQATELTATIAEQRVHLEKKDQQILELLRALRGKQRERVDPDQLVLFEIGELEQVLEEQQEASKPRRRRNPCGVSRRDPRGRLLGALSSLLVESKGARSRAVPSRTCGNRSAL